eukprot:gene2477-9405_t
MPARLFAFAAAAAGGAGRGLAHGEAAVSARVAASYPYMNGMALAAHRRAGNVTVFLVASGGGAFVVDVDGDPSVPRLAPSAPRPRLTFATPDGGSGGVVHRFAPRVLGPAADAVFVAAGRAGVVRRDAATYGATAQQVPGDVWSVACEERAAGGVAVAAGGWCWPVRLYRATAAAARLAATGPSLFARDALMDGGALLIAANAGGLRAFDVSAGRIAPTWRISAGGLASGLSQLPDGSVVAAAADAFGGQFQFFGGCASPVPCDADTRGVLGTGGVLVLSGAFGKSPAVRLNVTNTSGLCDFSGIHADATRKHLLLWQATVHRSGGVDYVLALCPQFMVMPLEGAVVNRDAFGIYGHQWDGLAVPPPGDVLYASTELGPAAFCLDAATCPPGKFGGGHPPGPGCIALAAGSGRIFCSQHCQLCTPGIAVFSVEGGDRFVPRFTGYITQDTPGFAPYAAPVAAPGLAPGESWLYATVAPHTVSLFDVTDPRPAAAQLLGTATVSPAPGSLVFGVAVLLAGRRHYAYVGYSSGPEAGIVVFEVSGARPELWQAGRVVAARNMTGPQA